MRYPTPQELARVLDKIAAKKAATLTLGQNVYYSNGRGMVFRAIVRRLHRDGSVSVEPYFVVDENGQDKRGFWGGHLVRLHRDDVLPSFALAQRQEQDQ